MPRRNWTHVRPTSLRHAMELCTEFALVKHNRSVEQLAELMGLNSHWVLYKWMSSGRMPANMIRPFEHACGAHYVTQYIGTSAHRLVIPIPSGRVPDGQDIHALQAAMTRAVGELLSYHRGEASAGDTINAIDEAMAGLAWHRETVNTSDQPGLPLDDGEA